MSSILQLYFPIILALLVHPSSQAQFSIRPKAVVIPVTKDAKSLRYVATISQGTPSVSVNLIVHLGGEIVTVACDIGYRSSSYRRPARCQNNTCQPRVENGVNELIEYGFPSTDVLSLRSMDGYNLEDTVSAPNFIFDCDRHFPSEGFPGKGIAGLGKSFYALPSQLADLFSFPRKFAMCLSSLSGESPGAIFFGDGPYPVLPDTDVSESFTYTKMISNPVAPIGLQLVGEGSFEYFIGVTSITISGKTLPLNASLLSIDREGAGGTLFSTVNSYSLLETSIYKEFTESFNREAAVMNITRAASVAPFGACFNSNSITSVRGRFQVPSIDLVLESNRVVWPVYPTNSMVQVSNDVLCLGFVDASTAEEEIIGSKASIILGGYQLENNLIQFDLATSRVGFTNLLYQFTTTCSSFFRSSV